MRSGYGMKHLSAVVVVAVAATGSASAQTVFDGGPTEEMLRWQGYVVGEFRDGVSGPLTEYQQGLEDAAVSYLTKPGINENQCLLYRIQGCPEELYTSKPEQPAVNPFADYDAQFESSDEKTLQKALQETSNQFEAIPESPSPDLGLYEASTSEATSYQAAFPESENFIPEEAAYSVDTSYSSVGDALSDPFSPAEADETLMDESGGAKVGHGSGGIVLLRAE